MDPKLIELLDRRPSALGNSAVVIVVLIASWLIGISLLIVSVSFLIHYLTCYELLAQFDIMENFKPIATNIIGISAFIVGVLLLFVVRLCKMLIKRNLFLIDLDLWRYEWEKRGIKDK